MKSLRLLSAFGLMMLFGCSFIPADINQQVDNSKNLAQVYKNIEGNVGTNIRWGGVIAKTQNKQENTWIEIVGKKLDSKARPYNNDDSNGRFLVRVNGFVDPLIFAKNREITITGSITGKSIGKIGEHSYEFAVVEAIGTHLWPKRKPRNINQSIYPISYWGPYFYGSYIRY